MRIYIPLESVTIAHVARPLQVAKKLREMGVEVIFGVQDRFKELISDEGFEARPLYSASHSMLLNSVRTLNFKQQNKALPKYLEADLASLKEAGHIDAVVGDFRFTLRLAAEHLNIPHIAITNGYYSQYYSVLPHMPRRFARYLPAALTESTWFRTQLKEVMLRQHAKPYQKLCKKYQLNSWIDKGFDIAVSKTLTLLCDLPEFTPQVDLPSHYRFVGPIQWEPSTSSADLVQIFANDQPLIYITLGTSGEESAIQELIKAFRNRPYNVIISTGNSALKNLPDNIHVCPFVKASDILKHASLMICHGGNGSIYQSIANRVPILCLTTFYDQEWNGQRVKELGLGESFDHKDIRFDQLLKRCEDLMRDPLVKGRLHALSESMQRWDGAKNAAEEIVAFLSKQSEEPLVL